MFYIFGQYSCTRKFNEFCDIIVDINNFFLCKLFDRQKINEDFTKNLADLVKQIESEVEMIREQEEALMV